MSSADRHRGAPRLSEQLKRLEQAHGNLPPAAFDLEDVVRGGRRRHRRRVALNVTAAAAAVIALAGVVILGPFQPSHPGEPALPAAPPTAQLSTAPALPRTDAGDKRLTYTQKGDKVTATMDGAVVATVSLASWTWTGDSGSVLLTITALRPVTITAEGFTVDGADGYNENSATNPGPGRYDIGQHEMRLTFAGKGLPSGLSWVLLKPKDADGDGFAGLWELNDRNRTR